MEPKVEPKLRPITEEEAKELLGLQPWESLPDELMFGGGVTIPRPLQEKE